MKVEWHEEAQNLMAQGNYEEAVNVAPNYPYAYLMRGIDKYNLAVKQSRKYHKPNEPLYEEALADFNKVLELDDSIVWGYMMKRYCLLKLGRKEEAHDATNKMLGK